MNKLTHTPTEMSRLDHLVELTIGTWKPQDLKIDFKIFETDVSTDENGVVRGVTCFVQRDNDSQYFSACQPTIEQAMKVAVLKSVGVSWEKIQEGLDG